MKFYAFNDDGKDIVNLLLDHNRTDSGTNGYCKGDKNPDLYNNAYCVTYEGKFTQQASTTATLYGVRSVIEVQKSKLS